MYGTQYPQASSPARTTALLRAIAWENSCVVPEREPGAATHGTAWAAAWKALTPHERTQLEASGLGQLMGGAPTGQQDPELARWLHDTVLQTLELIASGGHGTLVATQRVRKLAADSADALRLRIEPSTGEAGEYDLVEQLNAVVADMAARSACAVELRVGEMESAVTGRLAEQLVMASREALNNVEKHSHARSATLACRVRGPQASIRVRDDGVGFVPAATQFRGLRHSVLDRIFAAGGAAVIDSRPGAGTQVHMTVPLLRAPTSTS